MRLVHTSVATLIRVLVALCAPLLSAVAAQGETVNIRDLMVSYTSQSASGRSCQTCQKYFDCAAFNPARFAGSLRPTRARSNAAQSEYLSLAPHCRLPTILALGCDRHNWEDYGS